MNQHEAAFVRDFVRPERQARFLEAASSRKAGHAYFLDRLHRGLLDDLDPRFIREKLEFEGALRLTERMQCHVIASEPKYDGRELSVSDAFEVLWATSCGVIVSFIPGTLSGCKGASSPYIVWLLRDDGTDDTQR